MNTPTLPLAAAPARATLSWPLRHAQRALAALFEEPDEQPALASFRLAQRRATAARTLSALSADEPAQLARWLALQLAAAPAALAEARGRRLQRLDGALGQATLSLLAGAREDIAHRKGGDAAAA
jgi:hypothetical protein